MVNIYPEQIPSDAPASAKKVLAAPFELPNTYSVFHGMNWLNLNPRAKQRVGETDLIIDQVPNKKASVMTEHN